MQKCRSRWDGCIRWRRYLLTFVAFSVVLPRTGFSIDGLNVKFIDANPDYPSSNLYVAFCGQSDPGSVVAKDLTAGTARHRVFSYALAARKDDIRWPTYVARH